MLSPKAMNFVLSSCGTALTMTEKLQLPLCWRLSTASHVTFVVPAGNCVPDAGVQVTLTGGEPLVALGVSKDTVAGCALCAVTVASAGQVRTGSSTMGVG